MKKTIINPPTANKVKIAGVGSFNVDALQGTKKADLAAHFENLPADQAKAGHDMLWKAVSKGEMPEEPQVLSAEENPDAHG